MKLILPILILLGFWFLAGWSLVSGIADCYDYFFGGVETTGWGVAWAIVRIVPIAEILFVLGWLFGFGSFALFNK